MPSPYSRPYKTGTVSIENGSTALIGTDTAWQVSETSPLLMEGDEFNCNGLCVPIASIDSDTTATLELPWPGEDVVDDTYCIIKRSLKRFSPAESQDRATKFLLAVQGMTPVYHVGDEDEPDPARGEDGDIAIKWANAGAQFWRMVEGEWIELGHLGLSLKGSLSSSDDLPADGNVLLDAYLIDGHLWLWDGADWIQQAAGDSFALGIAISGRPKGGEMIEGHVFTDTIQFSDDFAGSRAVARTAPTAEAVFEIERNGVLVGTITFAAASAVGAFATSGALGFNAGDTLDLQAPDPADATFSGIKISLRGSRA